MTFYNQINSHFEESIKVKKAYLSNQNNLESFNQAVLEAVNSYRQGGKIYIAGNGGSAADAQHFAAELVCKLCRDRNPIPAEALTTDSSIITSIGNDYGYDEIFARQLKAKLKCNDLFIGISTSGNSENIIKAFEEVKKHNVKSILFTGDGGEKNRDICDYCIVVPSKKTAFIQETHIMILHTLCEAIENELIFSKSN